MNMFSRMLLGGALTAGFFAFGSSAAQADDHWLVCPGTSTATACVAVDTGDVSFTTTTVGYSDCGHLTSPDGCEVPIEAGAPVVSPVVDPPAVELYLQCGTEECVIPNPPPVNPGPISVIGIVGNLIDDGPIKIQVE